MHQQIQAALKLNFRDIDSSKWAANFKLKLRFCWQIANFQADAKKNPDQIEFRDKKREVLIELIDVLDDQDATHTLLTEEILEASMQMIGRNVYRTFTNKSAKKTQQVDPDEDEPHLEEAWPHLQLVYELFLKFMMSPQIPSKVMSAHISKTFIV